VIADVWTYARETDNGYDHVLRWIRALKTLGAVEDMSAAEAQDYADQHLAARWDPVAAELAELENAPGDYEPDQQVIADVESYAAETGSGFDHVHRWMRVLKTLGALQDMTAAEAQEYADQHLAERWDPVVVELRKLEAATSANPDLPASPQNFGLGATPGSLDLSATWDALEGAASYKLRWRLEGEEFGPDNATTVTENEATVTVAGHGRWVAGLQGCNDAGCGPEVEATADVGPFRFDVTQARDGAGNPRPRTFNANWSPVPDASGYRLNWRRLDGPDSQSPAQNQGGPSARSIPTGTSGDNGQDRNRLNIPGDQTGAEFTVGSDGFFEVDLEVLLPQSDDPIGLANTHLTARVTNPGNVTRFHQFECAKQSSKITGVYGDALNGGVRITWNTPGTAIDKYQYQIQQGNSFSHRRDNWKDIDPQAQPPTVERLVRNTNQPSTHSLALDRDYALAFRTGSSDTSFTLTAVDIDLSVVSRQGKAPDFSVAIYSDSSNRPYARLGRLTAPHSLSTGINTFTAPGEGIRMEPHIIYFLVFTVPDGGDWDVRIRATNSQNQTGGTGWTLGNNHLRRSHGETDWESRVGLSLRVDVQGYEEPTTRYGYLRARDLAGTTSFTLKGLENGNSYAILLRGVSGSRTLCFQKLIFVTPYQAGNIPAITGFDAYKGDGTGPQQAVLEWDDPGDPTLDYEYWYSGVPVHWSGWRGRGGYFRVEGANPVRTRDGKMKTVVNGLPCQNKYYAFRIRPSRDRVPGTTTGVNWIYLSSHGSNDDSILRGDDDGNCLSGWGGNDELYGYGGFDILSGGLGADELYGGNGNDWLNGGPGADKLYGGDGSDWADYSGAPGPVTVNMGAPANNTGHAAGDTYASIENVIGSDHADTLTGNSQNNVLRGGAGGDTLRGGDGADTADYSGSPAAVTVNIGDTSRESGGHAQGDRLSSIENIIGSDHVDTLTGDDGNNVLAGGAGGDTLRGGAGNDTADYSGSPAAVNVNLGDTNTESGGHAQGDTLISIENLTGSDYGDTLTGTSGANVLIGGPGDDTMDGRSGNDEFYFHPGFGWDTIEGFDVGSSTAAGDKIYLCGMEGVDYTGYQGSNSYRISVYSLDHWGFGIRTLAFQGSITLEGVTNLHYTHNQPPGNLNIIVPSRMGLTCDAEDIGRLSADANSPQNLAIESHYGAGISSVKWDAPGGGSVTNYKVEWLDAVTGEVKKSHTMNNNARSYDIGGKWLARWVRVLATHVISNTVTDAWSAVVAPPADPLQVWFADNTPNTLLAPGRVFFFAESNKADVTATCEIPGLGGGTINCPLRTTASLGHPSGAPVAAGTEVKVRVDTARTGGEFAGQEAETEAGGPAPPWAVASGGNGRMVIRWIEPREATDQIGSINGYVVQRRSRNTNGTWSDWNGTVKVAAARSHTFTGLAEGTWQVRVRARTDGNDNDPSTTDEYILGGTSPVRTVTVSRANVNPPQSPGATITPGDGKLTVNWRRPYADDRSLVYGYAVRHKVSGAPDSAYTATMVYPRPGQASGSVELTDLTNGTAYKVQIRSLNAVGVSRWLTIGFTTHTPNGIPPEPAPDPGALQVWFNAATGVTPNITGGRIFMNIATNKGSTSGQCFIHDGSADNSIPCPTNTLLSLPLPSGLTMVGSKIKVWATADASGETASTAGANAQEAVVGGPQPPWMWASGGNGKLLVGWDASPAAVTGQINAYIVQTRKQNADATWPDWTNTPKAASDREHTFTGLSNGNWQVRVRARNDKGDTNATTHILGTTSEVRKVTLAAGNTNTPTAPTDPAVTPDTGKLVVTWQLPDPDIRSLVHGYTVRHKVNSAADSTYVSTTVHPRRVDVECLGVPCTNPRRLEISGLTSGTAYKVQIKSLNANGASAWVTIGSTHAPN